MKVRKNSFYKTLSDPNHQQAFDQLLKEAWSREGAAMANSGIPYILDIINLMASVHNKRCVEELRKLVIEHDTRLREDGKKG